MDSFSVPDNFISQVGYTPAHHYGIEWRFKFDDLNEIDLSGQTAIVTGANSGIGFALSEHMYRMGAHVTMACRNPKKCQAAAAHIRKQNTSSLGQVNTGLINTETLASVKDFAMQYLHENPEKPLDMLFLNAGTVFANSELECVPLSKDGIERVFAANYVGHHLLFRLLEPALKKSALARVVSTSSCASFSSYSWLVATDLDTLNGCSEPWTSGKSNHSYGQSKLAQILWTKYLSQSRKDTNIYFNAFHPGVVATEIWEKAFEEAKAPAYIQTVSDWFQRNVMWTSAEGALTGLFLGTAVDRLKKEDIRGKYYHPQTQEVVNPLSLDEELQGRLWAFSEELVKDYLVVTDPSTASSARE